MMVSNRGSVFRLLIWQWKAVLFFSLISALVCLNWHFKLIPHVTLPTIPISVVGAAIGIFVSFRTNSSYDRWWEGRKLWGRMINSSRHFGTQVMTYINSTDKRQIELQQALIRRHIAYVHVLRCLLRVQDPFQDDDVRQYLTDEEQHDLVGHSNITHALLHKQSLALVDQVNDGNLNELRMQSFDKTIAALLDIQGGCERIKKTPMPRGYGFIASRLILFYACVFPFAIVEQAGWLTIPITILVCLAFELISEAGRVLEDPFTMFWNGLPLSAISTTIERNLLQCLDVPADQLPPGKLVNDQGILM